MPPNAAPVQGVNKKLSSSPPDIFHDFEWSDADEPHATRRRQIMRDHPEIKKLFVTEPLTCPIVLTAVAAQLLVARWASTADWGWVILVAYVFGGTVNHSMQLAAHELSHNLCFESGLLNRLLTVVCNLCTGVPSGLTFKKYHLDHHQYQGVDTVDTDVPTVGEVNFFMNITVRKIVWMMLQPFFYGLRPLVVKPKPASLSEIAHFAFQMAFNYFIYQYWGGKALAYLVLGTFLGMGLHPAAGHFIAEHYTFIQGKETYSYYGVWNYLNFNVGYHMEHHDFPRIPWSKLPEVRKIAPEYYVNEPFHSSYVKVIYDYLTDNTMGPYSRVKRSATYYKSGAKDE